MVLLANYPKVSVIMPVFNAQSYLDEAIQSVLDQTYENWELVIINDGSIDGTEDIIKKYISDSRIIYLKQENKGPSAARNLGIRMAGGEWVSFLDADDFWLNNKLEFQVKYLVKHPETVMLHSACSVLKDNKLCTPLKYLPFLAWNLKGFLYDKLIEEDFVNMLTVILRKEIFSNVGYFDETLSGGADWDLWLRISRIYKIDFINKILAVYRYNISGISKNIAKYKDAVYCVIKKNILEKPHIPEMVQKKSLSNFYTGIGNVHFFNRSYGKSKAYSLIGLRYCPFNYKPYRLYLSTFVMKTREKILNKFLK